jgi:3-oxoadipate enol-lactonase
MMSTDVMAVTSGIRLRCAVEGDPAGTPLVLINSLGSDLRLWDGLLPHLGGRWRVIRYDQRGQGQSETPPGPYQLRDHVYDLGGLLEQLGVERPALLGLSVGGLIAMDYVGQFPGRARALVLSDTAPRIGTPEGWTERMEGIREYGMPEMAAGIIGRWVTPGFVERRPADYESLRQMLLRSPLEGYLATCAVLRDADLEAVLPQLSVPTLVMCGAKDISTPPAQMRALAQGALPRARFEVIEGAAHLPCIEQPEAVAAALEAFSRDMIHGN